MWSGIKSVVGCWTWIWCSRHCGLGLKVACWFQWMLKRMHVLFNRSNNTGAIDTKMDESILKEKWSFKMLGLTSALNWVGFLTLSLLLKLPPRKLELWFALSIFFHLRLLCVYKSTIRPCLSWCSRLLRGNVRYLTKTDMHHCWSFTCCLFWTLGSSSKCSQLKSFLYV